MLEKGKENSAEKKYQLPSVDIVPLKLSKKQHQVWMEEKVQDQDHRMKRRSRKLTGDQKYSNIQQNTQENVQEPRPLRSRLKKLLGSAEYQFSSHTELLLQYQ